MSLRQRCAADFASARLTTEFNYQSTCKASGILFQKTSRTLILHVGYPHPAMPPVPDRFQSEQSRPRRFTRRSPTSITAQNASTTPNIKAIPVKQQEPYRYVPHPGASFRGCDFGRIPKPELEIPVNISAGWPNKSQPRNVPTPGWSSYSMERARLRRTSHSEARAGQVPMSESFTARIP